MPFEERQRRRAVKRHHGTCADWKMREVAVRSWDMVVDYFTRGLSLRAVAGVYGVCHTTVWEAVQHYIGRFLCEARRRAGRLRLWGRAYVKACKASRLLDAVSEFEGKPSQQIHIQQKQTFNWRESAREAAAAGGAARDGPDLSEEARRYLEAKGRLCPPPGPGTVFEFWD